MSMANGPMAESSPSVIALRRNRVSMGQNGSCRALQRALSLRFGGRSPRARRTSLYFKRFYLAARVSEQSVWNLKPLGEHLGRGVRRFGAGRVPLITRRIMTVHPRHQLVRRQRRAHVIALCVVAA